jgi:hypothetical protein
LGLRIVTGAQYPLFIAAYNTGTAAKIVWYAVHFRKTFVLKINRLIKPQKGRNFNLCLVGIIKYKNDKNVDFFYVLIFANLK